MKKTRTDYLWSLLLMIGLAIVTVSSCKDDNDGTTEISPEEAARNEYFKYNASEVQVVEETTFNVLDELEKRIAANSDANSEEEQTLLDYYQAKHAKLKAFANRVADSIAAVEPGNSMEAIAGQLLEMGRVTLTYDDDGADGKRKRMSLLVVFPTRFFVNIDAKNIILGCHYTICSNHERPTNTGFQGLSDACLLGAEWATTENCLVIMPDYEGYGESKDATHPYLNREVQARQTLKALTVGMNWFTGKHGEEFSQGNIVVEGFSQGGAVAAATYRYWLEHLNEDWTTAIKTPIVGAVCGDGPYDPLATLQYYCQSRMLSMPVAPALMLKGLCETDEDAIKAGLQVSDFVSDAFYKSGIFARIGSKLYTTDGCEDALREYNKDHPGSFSFIDDKLPTDQALNQATFQYFLDGTEPADPEMLRKLKALKFCLEKNSLFYKFNPATINFDLKTPMPAAFGTGYMTYHIKPQFSFFHGRYDTVVPVDNLFSIMNNWGSGAAKYVQTDRLYDHGQLGEAFFLGLHDELVEEMLNGEWEPALKAYNTSIPNIINTLKGH